MARRFRAQTKIAWRPHQCRAKMMLPDAIHHDARGERVVGAGDGACEFEPAAALFEGLALWPGNHFQELPRHFLTEARGAAALEHTRIRLRFAVSQDESGRGAEFDQPTVNLALQLPQLLDDAGGEETLIVDDRSIGHDSRRAGIAQKHPQLSRARRI